MSNTKPKVISLNQNKIQILSDNILYNNGIITAFYILPTINYSTASYNGILRSITELKNLLSSLASQRPNICFTIEQIEKIVKAKDVEKNLLETIRLYRPEFEMPLEFTSHIRNQYQSYSLLGIDIQQKDFTDVEDYTFTETMKTVLKNGLDKFTGLGDINLDEKKILDIEKNIFSVIRHKCLRASKELVFYNYVSKLYPSYDISYDELSYINERNFENIMGAVTQTVSDNFGWFELHNDGVDLFGLPIQTTYGCMIDVKNFPISIYSANFPMEYPGCVTTIKCLKKEEAALKLKRTRSADKFELDQAAQVGAETEALEEAAKAISIATNALQDLDDGETMCQFNCSILVASTSLDKLKQNVVRIISSCQDRDITVAKSLTQATDFLDNYVNLKPKKFDHMSLLQFPLSFQQNSGSIAGDSDQGIFSPAIGEDLQ